MLRIWYLIYIFLLQSEKNENDLLLDSINIQGGLKKKK